MLEILSKFVQPNQAPELSAPKSGRGLRRLFVPMNFIWKLNFEYRITAVTLILFFLIKGVLFML